LGCDLDKITQDQLDIITNQELIDVNQDALGVQGYCRLNCGAISSIAKPQVYAGPLANGDVAAVIINWEGSNHG
jgi:alpha-galactosidase